MPNKQKLLRYYEKTTDAEALQLFLDLAGNEYISDLLLQRIDDMTEEEAQEVCERNSIN